jgi:hypothetical protein
MQLSIDIEDLDQKDKCLKEQNSQLLNAMLPI